MQGLRNFCPTRRSFGFERVEENKPDEFFELHFANLFIEIYALVQKAFCPGPDFRAPGPSPWRKEFSDEFINYVEMLARPDPRAKRWEMLLRDPSQRSPLLQAVIHKVLHTSIFPSSLFGAHPTHKKIMEESDAALLYVEGFQRSDLHAHMNQTYLKDSDGMPPFFWDEVDKLCTQAYTMLLPAREYAADHKYFQPMPLRDMYQSLHDIVAYAAWIHVCIRTSSAIVSFDWRIPGEYYNMNVVNLSHEVYESSALAAKQHEKNYKKKGAKKEYMESTARVKISVAPEITRHKPMIKTRRSQGMTSYKLMKPHAVFYCGYEEATNETVAFQSLPDYLYQLRRRQALPMIPAFMVTSLTVGAALVNFTAFGHEAWVLAQTQLMGLLASGQAVAEEALFAK